MQENDDLPIKSKAAPIKPKKFENGNLPALINRN